MLRLSIAFFAIVAATASAQDTEEKALLANAIKARGGEEKLLKLKAMWEKTKGSMFVGDEVYAFSGEVFINYPSQHRLIAKVQFKDKEFSETRVRNGAVAWAVDEKGKLRDFEGKELEELREELFHDDLMRLTPLLDAKNFTLALLGEAKVEGKAAVGLKVLSPGHRDLQLFFDKETFLLVKIAREGYDNDAKKLVPQEQVFSNYKTVDGLPYAMKWVGYHDGKKQMEVEVTEVNFLESVPARMFVRPRK